MHGAVISNDIEIVKMLLDNNASVNAADSCGNKPLFYTKHPRIEMIKLLLSHGADPYIENLHGASMFYVYQAYPHIIER